MCGEICTLRNDFLHTDTFTPDTFTPSPFFFSPSNGFDYTGAVDCAKKILHREGPMAFLDGLPARVAWLLPRCALAMAGFECTMRALNAPSL